VGFEIFAPPDADATPHGWGGRLCLMIVNSVLWRRGPAPEETLQSYDQLIERVAKAGWLSDPHALRDDARAHPRRAARALATALELREALFSAFSAVAADHPPTQAAIRLIEQHAATGLATLHLEPRPEPGAHGEPGHRLRYRWSRPTLDTPTCLIAVSAALLLTAPELDRVKQCPGPTCGWVFLDTTRNRSRQWCETSECSNRHRARTHYQRRQRQHRDER
jgi:predicted RNA-binding Zn ribbon-like protein